MALTISRDTTALTFAGVYRATSGGTVFSANLASSAAFDYFSDSAVVDDCIYFYASNRSGMTNFRFNVGTPIVATDLVLVWEYYNRDGTWHAIEDLSDGTNGFTTTGRNYVNSPLQWEPDKISINGTLQFWIRCRIVSLTVNGLMIMSTGPSEGTFDDIHIIQIGANMFYCYLSSFTLRNTSWVKKYASTFYFFFLYQASGDVDQEFVLLNPKEELPTMDSTSGMLPVKINPSNATLTSCKIYSGGTYTDYTTQIQNFTVDDVPLTGEVGDCILFGGNPSYIIQAYGWGLNATISSQLNDYTYVWEYYDGSDWVTLDGSKVKDGTFNFTQSGILVLFVPTTMPSATIDGVSAKWCRIRITEKGTETPTMTHSYQRISGCFSNWKVMEKYSVNLEVRDESGSPIEGATVTATDENGDEIFSVVTDADGQIEEQQVVAKEWHLDVNESGLIAETVYSTFSIKIQAQGSQPVVVMDMDIIGPKMLAITLKRSPMLGQGRIS